MFTKERFEESKKNTIYVPYYSAPVHVKLVKMMEYAENKGCYIADLSDEEKAHFIDGGLEGLSEIRKWNREHNQEQDNFL